MPTLPPPHPSGRGKAAIDISSTGKKHRREDSTAGSEASVDLTFPQDASAYSDFGSILPQVERLLLPEDESRLNEMGLSQAVDWGLSHQFQKLKASNLEAKKIAHEASSHTVEATLELKKLKSDVDLLEAKLKAKESDYDSLYDRLEDDVLNPVIKTRAHLMRDFKQGHVTE
ncbi:hypothetical protein ACOSQ4_019152 [Xanthoceras sorbifolium]